jgi:hypothetical protein
MSGWELPRRFEDSDCYRAYKSVDPAGVPDSNFCTLLWISIEHIINGIQQAGPELTPDTFAEGLYSMPLQQGRGPWAVAGGYSPGDHAFVDTLMEMYWDPEAVDPDGGEPGGAYRFNYGGRRFRPGELTSELVRDGVTGYRP